MSAVYFMGAKSGTKKKDGSFYANCSLLFKNQFGDFVCGGQYCGWFPDKETFEACVSGLAVGTSVKVFRDMAGMIVNIAENPEFPDLLLE